MCASLDDALQLADLSDAETALLDGATRPIVLVRLNARSAGSSMARSVAPGLHEIGLMLPYTPLHHLLLEAAKRPLVMTSGNVSEEPIAGENLEAVERLAGIADAYLLHDRGIYARYDDSVVRVVGDAARMIRRARGFCPLPLPVEAGDADVLALGAHLKNTFCILKTGRAFAGPHIGDLDNPLAFAHQDEALRTYLRLFRSRPTTVASDLHPDYASTRLAQRWWDEGAEEVRVQHHHAHIASVLAEHGLRGNVLGVAFDGIGLGPDGSIWGGEFLLCDERSYRRAGHIAAVRQPGGDACAREGWRMAIAYQAASGAPADAPPPWMAEVDGLPDQRRWRLVSRLASSVSAPVSTSAGRLFDAVSSLLGVAARVDVRGRGGDAPRSPRRGALAGSGLAARQAAWAVMTGWCSTPSDWSPPSSSSAASAARRGNSPRCSMRASPRASPAMCVDLATDLEVDRVALSGGVFQNALLLARVEDLLRDRGPAGLLEPAGARQRRGHQPGAGARGSLTRLGGAPDMIGQVEQTGRAFLEERFGATTHAGEAFFAQHAGSIATCAAAMADRFFAGGSLLVFGAGPHATDAQHNSVEFVHPALPGCRALPALSLSNDIATVTAMLQGEGAADVFAHQVRVLGRDGDIALAFGHAPLHESIIRGLRAGASGGMLTVALTSGEMPPAPDLADYRFHASTGAHGIARELHLATYHMLWELVHIVLNHRGIAPPR